MYYFLIGFAILMVVAFSIRMLIWMWSFIYEISMALVPLALFIFVMVALSGGS